MHSFGLTERWIVLAEFPFVVNPLRLALQRPALHRELPLEARARDAVHADRPRDRRGAAARSTTDACFGFHHVNAYEDGDEVVVDICVFADAGIVEDLYLERLRAGKPVAEPELRRFRIGPATGTVDAASGSPRTASSCRGSTTAAATSAPTATSGASASAATGWLDADRQGRPRAARDARSGRSPAAIPGEPVFVAAPGRRGEDEGVLLSVVLDAERGTSFLLVLDARDLERARARRGAAPHPVRLPRAVRAYGLSWEIPPMQRILQIS